MPRVNTALLTGKTEVRKLQKFHIFCEGGYRVSGRTEFWGWGWGQVAHRDVGVDVGTVLPTANELAISTAQDGESANRMIEHMAT